MASQLGPRCPFAYENTEIKFRRGSQKPAARMSAAKSAAGAVKSAPDVATLILATLTGAVGCRRIHRS
jgi:hypothetical protein